MLLGLGELLHIQHCSCHMSQVGHGEKAGRGGRVMLKGTPGAAGHQEQDLCCLIKPPAWASLFFQQRLRGRVGGNT